MVFRGLKPVDESTPLIPEGIIEQAPAVEPEESQPQSTDDLITEFETLMPKQNKPITKPKQGVERGKGRKELLAEITRLKRQVAEPKAEESVEPILGVDSSRLRPPSQRYAGEERALFDAIRIGSDLTPHIKDEINPKAVQEKKLDTLVSDIKVPDIPATVFDLEAKSPLGKPKYKASLEDLNDGGNSVVGSMNNTYRDYHLKGVARQSGFQEVPFNIGDEEHPQTGGVWLPRADTTSNIFHTNFIHPITHNLIKDEIGMQLDTAIKQGLINAADKEKYGRGLTEAYRKMFVELGANPEKNMPLFVAAHFNRVPAKEKNPAAHQAFISMLKSQAKKSLYSQGILTPTNEQIEDGAINLLNTGIAQQPRFGPALQSAPIVAKYRQTVESIKNRAGDEQMEDMHEVIKKALDGSQYADMTEGISDILAKAFAAEKQAQEFELKKAQMDEFMKSQDETITKIVEVLDAFNTELNALKKAVEGSKSFTEPSGEGADKTKNSAQLKATGKMKGSMADAEETQNVIEGAKKEINNFEKPESKEKKIIPTPGQAMTQDRGNPHEGIPSLNKSTFKEGIKAGEMQAIKKMAESSEAVVASKPIAVSETERMQVLQKAFPAISDEELMNTKNIGRLLAKKAGN